MTVSGCPAAWLLIKIGNSRLRNRKSRKLCVKKLEKNSTFVNKDRLLAPHQGYNKGYKSSASRFTGFISTFTGEKE